MGRRRRRDEIYEKD